MLPAAADVPPEQAEETIKTMKIMYGICDGILTEQKQVFTDCLLTICGSPKKEPSVYGAAMGLLYASDSSYGEKAENIMSGYLRGSEEIKKQGSLYIKGLFETARDIALSDKNFLKLTDELITSVTYDDFVEILPSLRLAFSYFTPSEIQKAAETIAKFSGTDKSGILFKKAVDENLYAFGAALDTEIIGIIE